MLFAENSGFNIGMTGCWAEGHYENPIIQNYIKVSEGIYITSSQNDIVLREGIRLNEITSEQVLQENMDLAIQEQKKASGKLDTENTSLPPVYEVTFSKKILDIYKDEGENAEVCVYIKCDAKEFEPLGSNTVFITPIQDHEFHSNATTYIESDNTSYYFFILMNKVRNIIFLLDTNKSSIRNAELKTAYTKGQILLCRQFYLYRIHFYPRTLQMAV